MGSVGEKSCVGWALASTVSTGSKRSSCLSELLQNADDARATEASVRIEAGEFIFGHNGDDFSEEHFTSLCRFGFSNKRALHTIWVPRNRIQECFQFGRFGRGLYADAFRLLRAKQISLSPNGSIRRWTFNTPLKFACHFEAKDGKRKYEVILKSGLVVRSRCCFSEISAT